MTEFRLKLTEIKTNLMEKSFHDDKQKIINFLFILFVKYF